MCSTRERLAALLREERESRGMTLRQAAMRAAIAPSTLSRWESGACTPRVPELEALLRALGVDDRDILRVLASLDAPRAAKAARASDLSGLVAPSGGALLRALRHRAGLSLVEVAMHLGVAASTLSRWESSVSHPVPKIAEALLDLLEASDEERVCVMASGVAKLKVHRPEYRPEAYAAELEACADRVLDPTDDSVELRLLQLQSLLWWSVREPGALEQLLRAHILYGRFLTNRGRYEEAAREARLVLQESSDEGEDLAVMAHRIAARAAVFRWPKPRPHMGLFLLQRVSPLAKSESARAGVLADMAEYSRLAGRIEEAVDYQRRSELLHSAEKVPCFNPR